MRRIFILFIFCLFTVKTSPIFGQEHSTSAGNISFEQYQRLLQRVEDLEKRQVARDSVRDREVKNRGRLQVGGYGEIVMHRFLYSSDFTRYYYPEQYKNAKGYGQFDLPHVVFTVAYDFGKGWKVSSEIEYEHGGTGSAIEIEADEFGEYESEIERGGEVVLEQFWIEKSFTPAANIRAGHIIIPIGLTNARHLPTEFFSVIRQEEETTILPCTWHETGISFWGKKNGWRYEAIFTAGLDADMFNDANWIKGGATSAYEFKIANTYAGAFRVDNFSVKGLRVGLSGYYGHSARNSLKSENYKGLNGAVILGALDLEYKGHDFWLLANADYGHLSDSKEISAKNKNMAKNSPSPRTNVASDALCGAIYLGYNFFGLNQKLANKNMKFFVFGHYGYVNSMFKTAEGILADKRFEKHIVSGGINFYPIKELVVKMEFQSRLFSPKTTYNTENTVSIGICYAGMFDIWNKR
ncbi:MAG: hypothetical protein LBR51_05320 [Bacteroidales bacterium]|jgi:hypothetical protein|nr:hypothetical protein [Bacteroidales bacterium]